MDYLERKYTYKHDKCPRIWFRFIGDIWGIFRGSTLELKVFIEFCSSIHETIKFTIKYSKTSINFLDVITCAEDSKIKSTLYVKPTNSHRYLDYDSCH